MEDVHRKAIQSNYVSLVEQTDLDLMVSSLYERGVFSARMIERYTDTSKEVRTRQRQLYLDIMRRGPEAFNHLTDALQEAGYWNLARDLDPNSSLHITKPHQNLESTYISIKTERNKQLLEAKNHETRGTPATATLPTSSAPNNDTPGPEAVMPSFEVKKSTKFVEDNDTDIGLYKMRGPREQRGVLLVFSYIEFKNNIEDVRNGVDVDAAQLKYLFSEIGFKVRSYFNLTKNETEATLGSLAQVLAGAECVFVVVSSHGYARSRASDVDFRCHDGGLISIYEFLDYFHHTSLPELRGVPKVFIFQNCRGDKDQPGEVSHSDAGRSEPDARACPAPPLPAPPPLRAPPALCPRLYDDMLIAHSTVPGFVAMRDEKKGSWYIQVLCEVFAEHAHHRHLEELLKLADERLKARFRKQTSTVESWGFNRRLYLHPGLFPQP